jgi:hypothetical protein
MKNVEKRAIVKGICDAAVTAIHKKGSLIDPKLLGDPKGPRPMQVENNDVIIMFTTPFTGFFGAPAPYGIDIWTKGPGPRIRKVFTAWWSKSTDEIVSSYVRLGPWVPNVLALSI